jgi:hypothetical protein
MEDSYKSNTAEIAPQPGPAVQGLIFLILFDRNHLYQKVRNVRTPVTA